MRKRLKVLPNTLGWGYSFEDDESEIEVTENVEDTEVVENAPSVPDEDGTPAPESGDGATCEDGYEPTFMDKLVKGMDDTQKDMVDSATLQSDQMPEDEVSSIFSDVESDIKALEESLEPDTYTLEGNPAIMDGHGGDPLHPVEGEEEVTVKADEGNDASDFKENIVPNAIHIIGNVDTDAMNDYLLKDNEENHSDDVLMQGTGTTDEEIRGTEITADNVEDMGVIGEHNGDTSLRDDYTSDDEGIQEVENPEVESGEEEVGMLGIGQESDDSEIEVETEEAGGEEDGDSSDSSDDDNNSGSDDDVEDVEETMDDVAEDAENETEANDETSETTEEVMEETETVGDDDVPESVEETGEPSDNDTSETVEAPVGDETVTPGDGGDVTTLEVTEAGLIGAGVSEEDAKELLSDIAKVEQGEWDAMEDSSTDPLANVSIFKTKEEMKEMLTDGSDYTEPNPEEAGDNPEDGGEAGEGYIIEGEDGLADFEALEEATSELPIVKEVQDGGEEWDREPGEHLDDMEGGSSEGDDYSSDDTELETAEEVGTDDVPETETAEDVDVSGEPEVNVEVDDEEAAEEIETAEECVNRFNEKWNSFVPSYESEDRFYENGFESSETYRELQRDFQEIEGEAYNNFETSYESTLGNNIFDELDRDLLDIEK